MYNTRKGNSYVLLDISSLSEQDFEKTKNIKIVTNSEDVLRKNRNIFRANSDKDNSNEKFIIFKYLTSVLTLVKIDAIGYISDTRYIQYICMIYV